MMGSCLTPVIANFYVVFFEQWGIDVVAKKSAYWHRYMDDIFIIWTRRKEELHMFLQHLNSIHSNIKFMKVEQNSTLSFLDVW
jgi:hypothetical protein